MRSFYNLWTGIGWQGECQILQWCDVNSMQSKNMAAVVNYCCFAGTAQLPALPLARAGQVVLLPPSQSKMMAGGRWWVQMWQERAGGRGQVWVKRAEGNLRLARSGRLGGKHRSGNWPLVQARLEQKLRGKRGILVTAFTLHILRRCLIGSPDF